MLATINIFGIFLQLLLVVHIKGQDTLQLISFVHSDYLQNFNGYGFVTIIHFQVPEDSEFASFKFLADQVRFSIFQCHHDEVIIYLKHGSIPLVNPNNAKLPENLYNVSYSPILYTHTSDKKPHYINITNPKPGYYYAAAFHPFVDPKNEGITQAGLTPQCSTFIDASLYVRKYFVLDLERNNAIAITIPTYTKDNQTYKFHIPEVHDRLVVTVSSIIFCDTCTTLTAQLFDENGHNDETIILNKTDHKGGSLYYRINAMGTQSYYIQFFFKALNPQVDDYAHLTFDIKSFRSVDNNTLLMEGNSKVNGPNVTANVSALYQSAVYQTSRFDYLFPYISYKEYALVKSEKTDSFSYTFDLQPNAEGVVPLSINLTNTDFSLLKFILSEVVDTGGTLEYTIGFSPRITRESGKIKKEREPVNHTVIICIRNSLMEMPTWPNNCTYENQTNLAPIVLNRTVLNSTVKFPYPESGTWYVTLKLYCGDCIPCKCPDTCIERYETCIEECEIMCEGDACDNCTTTCINKMMKRDICNDHCNCDGPCRKSKGTCNTSIIFDISSNPCISGSCGKNGRCAFAIAQGMLYSTCLCTNHYKGLNCADDSDATSYGMIVLELCLLVLSNIIFVPTAYYAYKRRYYVETIVYISTFLSSSFYHMCDAGEKIISVCIVQLSVLQFADFFSGLLAIWVTLIALAYLPYPWYSISHITGCIVLAFGTTFNKESLGVFAMPTVIGILIIIGRWVYIRRKTRKSFPKRSYLRKNLPVGILVVVTGLLLYGLFETHNNYKYIHSLWHLLMGLGVIILLPASESFLPPDEDHSRGDLLT